MVLKRVVYELDTGRQSLEQRHRPLIVVPFS